MSYTTRPYKEKCKLIKDKCLAEKTQAVHSSVKRMRANKNCLRPLKRDMQIRRRGHLPQRAEKDKGASRLLRSGGLHALLTLKKPCQSSQGHSTNVTSFRSVQNCTIISPPGICYSAWPPHVPTPQACSLNAMWKQAGGH